MGPAQVDKLELWQAAVLLGRDEEPPDAPLMYEAHADAPADPDTGLRLRMVE